MREAERREPRGELPVMLLGEDLGRRHHRCLPPALDGADAPERGDNRLAAADVALQQAVHRVGFGEVTLDLAPGAGLRRGEPEG